MKTNNGQYYKILWNLNKICGAGGGLVTKSCLTLATPWTLARQGPLSMGFSTQGHWSGLPFSSPEDLPNPGIEPGSPALQAESLLTELWGKMYKIWWTKPVLQLIILYHLFISCFFCNSKVFLYILKIGLEFSSLIQVHFFKITKIINCLEC